VNYSLNYADLVEILKLSLDREPARQERFEAFRRAVWFYLSSVGTALPEAGVGVTLVGGTNGKGTVSKTLETLLASSGARVGLFTSPHLIEPTERIRSMGRDLTQIEMVQAYVLIEDTVRQFDLSHFEILTLMMIEVFFGDRIRPRVDLAIIEVGVGGRLDPTRVVPHETAVLARIGLDHQALLGSTLPEIASEKLAIAEGARRLIYMKPDASLNEVFADAQQKFSGCEFIEARSFASTVDRSTEVGAGGRAPSIPSWTIKTPWGEARLALMGERAVQNTSLALEVLAQTDSSVAKLLPAVAKVEWPCRMERLTFAGRPLFLSGDHNELGVESLYELLSRFQYQKLWIVAGISKGKPIKTMIDLYLQNPRANLILTRTTFRPIELSALEPFRPRAVAIVDGALRALELALSLASPNDLVVVSGSLYLVGDLRAQILSRS
jgi:dihydrofolate synthase/folylpolyglutamate synthase